jgi:hypothetical protein
VGAVGRLQAGHLVAGQGHVDRGDHADRVGDVEVVVHVHIANLP